MSSGPDPTLDKSQVIALFRETDEQVLTTSEVSDELPVSQRTIQIYLKRLLEDGKLERKEVGANATVWWLDEDALTANDLSFVEIKSGNEKIENTISHWPLQLSLTECFVLSSLDIPGDRSQLPERRCAILEAYLLLRDQEKVSKREFVSRLFSKHQAGYSNSNSWWERLIRENLEQFPSVSKASRGGEWRFNIDHDSITEQSYTQEVIDTDISVPIPVAEKIDRPPRALELVDVVLAEWEPDFANPAEISWASKTGRQAVKWLTIVDIATRDEFVDELFPGGPVDDEIWWWRKGVEPALKTAMDYGYVKRTSDGYTSRFPIRGVWGEIGGIR